MASSGYDIARAGWLYRQSSVLHRWKRNWFVLDRQGDLRYFENQGSPTAVERLVVRAVLSSVKTGPACTHADPPEGMSASKSCFLELVFRDGKTMLLYADSSDDVKAWQIALEDARTMVVRGPPVGVPGSTIIHGPNYMYNPYIGYQYPGHVISTSTSTTPGACQVVQGPNGSTTTIVNAPPAQQIVYVDESPYMRHCSHRHNHCYRGYRGGTTYMGPMFWW